MKLTSHLILLGAMVMAVTSCNFVSKAKETAENAQSVAQAAENIAKSGEAISKRVEARRAKGDTLAMPYKELANFMPSGVSGYEPAHDPAGQTMNMQGFSYSSYEQEYKKGEESTVKIQLIDYNAAAALLSMSTMALATGIEMENESQITKSWNPGVDDVKGYEEYGKQSKDAKVILSVADRFFVQVSATNQPNTDFVKDVAKSIKLSDLAGH